MYNGTDVFNLHAVLFLIEYPRMLDFDDGEIVSCVVPEVRPSRQGTI